MRGTFALRGWSAYEKASEPIAKSYVPALWLLSRSYDVKEAAALLSFATSWVRSLVKRYNECGLERLCDQSFHNGAESSLPTQ